MTKLVSALDSELGGLCSSTGEGHHVVFLSKTLYSHIVSLSNLTQPNRWVLVNC